tara:strand:- start:266 stop:394 length:129 start_codon:yes stop_codon:yes gene_type:complete
LVVKLVGLEHLVDLHYLYHLVVLDNLNYYFGYLVVLEHLVNL